MTIKQKRKRTWFWGLAVSFLLLSVLCISLSSCELSATGSVDALRNEYVTSLAYYQAQMASVTTQMDDLEQQMLSLHENYIARIDTLSLQLQEIKEKQTPPDAAESGSAVPKQPPQDTEDVMQSLPEVSLCEYKYRLENGAAILTAYLGDDAKVVIPAAVDGYVVKGLDDRAFAGTKVQSVKIPDTVQSIGWFSFYECDQLKEIFLPSTLSSIGYASFDGCDPQLCLYVAQNSYAENFAVSFGLKHQNIF